MIRPPQLIYLLFFISLVMLPEAFSNAAQTQRGRIGCPHCRNDGSEVSLLLQEADNLYTSFKPKEALKKLLKVIRLDPQNYEGLAKTSRAYIDFGDMMQESDVNGEGTKLEQYLIAEKYARMAVKANPDSTWGHFYVATSLGKIANQSSTSRQIDLSFEIREAIKKAIALDPQNGFAYHVYGVWHRKLAEIGQMGRVVVSWILWRSVPQGSLEESVDYLKKAISLNPKAISHRLELGRTYMAIGQWNLARDFLESVQELPVQFSDDSIKKKEAIQLLREIEARDHG
ncbi:MAG: hypothetical protein V3U06_08970 [Candidatus Binatia bacterium]